MNNNYNIIVNAVIIIIIVTCPHIIEAGWSGRELGTPKKRLILEHYTPEV